MSFATFIYFFRSTSSLKSTNRDHVGFLIDWNLLWFYVLNERFFVWYYKFLHKI